MSKYITDDTDISSDDSDLDDSDEENDFKRFMKYSYHLHNS